MHRDKTLSVTIPPGVEDGTRIRLAGEGEAGTRGGTPGDLYIFVSVAPHRLFQRDGRNLYCRIPIPLTTAALGGQIDVTTALERGAPPLRDFMLKQTRETDLALFVDLARLPRPSSPQELPMRVIIPAYAISELKTGFQMGFFLFVPFLLVDLVVSTTLLSMGMLQLPPAMVSLPFKVLLFVMIDGWNLVVGSIVRSFS